MSEDGNGIMRRTLWVGMLALGMVCTGEEGCAQMPGDEKLAMTHSFAVFALSRGKGVPQPTHEVFQKVQALLEQAKEQGQNIELTRERVGIEGEKRICAKFVDLAEAQTMLERVRELTKGTELIELVIEPCPGN